MKAKIIVGLILAAGVVAVFLAVRRPPATTAISEPQLPETALSPARPEPQPCCRASTKCSFIVDSLSKRQCGARFLEPCDRTPHGLNTVFIMG